MPSSLLNNAATLRLKELITHSQMTVIQSEKTFRTQRYEGRSTIKGIQLKSSSTEGRLMAVIIWHTFLEIPNTSLLSTCILVYIAGGLVNNIT